MSIPVLMPALSPTMTEGKLAKWHVKVGDAVKSASGLMYPVQLVKRLKYLSRPARNGPTPSPIRSTHQAWSNRESNPLFMCASSKRMELAGANRLQADASISLP